MFYVYCTRFGYLETDKYDSWFSSSHTPTPQTEKFKDEHDARWYLNNCQGQRIETRSLVPVK